MDTKEGALIEARVKSGSAEFRFLEKEGSFVIEVRSPPREGRANTEIVKELGKMFKAEVQIMHGLKSKNKTILIRGLTDRDVRERAHVHA